MEGLNHFVIRFGRNYRCIKHGVIYEIVPFQTPAPTPIYAGVCAIPSGFDTNWPLILTSWFNTDCDIKDSTTGVAHKRGDAYSSGAPDLIPVL